MIEECHVQEHEQEGYHEGYETCIDGLGSKGRTYNLFLDDGCRGREFSGLEHIGKVFCLLKGEVAGDFRTSSCNLSVDCRV